MKTAMQELIDEIVEHLTYDDDLTDDNRTSLETIRLRCLIKLTKEKEQIIYACNSAFEDTTSWGERYYNKTYNK